MQIDANINLVLVYVDLLVDMLLPFKKSVLELSNSHAVNNDSVAY